MKIIHDNNKLYDCMTTILIRFYMTELPSYSAGDNISFVATNLSSDTEYVFISYASSVVGDGAHSDWLRVKTGELSAS